MHILNKTPKNRLLTLTAENVLKVMNGRKTQTRRYFNPSDYTACPDLIDGVWWGDDQYGDAFPIPCRNGRPGDTLSVAEGYQVEQYYEPLYMISGRYLADGANFEIVLNDAEWMKYADRKRPYAPTPGRFMYRSLARTQLLLTDVRAERLQAITQGDVLAEGIQLTAEEGDACFDPYAPVTARPKMMNDWIQLWDSINGRDGRRWADNPWVWVIQFARIIDWVDTACQGRTYKLDMGNGGRDTYHVCSHASCDPTVAVDDRPWSYAGPDHPAV